MIRVGIAYMHVGRRGVLLPGTCWVGLDRCVFMAKDSEGHPGLDYRAT